MTRLHRVLSAVAIVASALCVARCSHDAGTGPIVDPWMPTPSLPTFTEPASNSEWVYFRRDAGTHGSFSLCRVRLLGGDVEHVANLSQMPALRGNRLAYYDITRGLVVSDILTGDDEVVVSGNVACPTWFGDSAIVFSTMGGGIYLVELGHHARARTLYSSGLTPTSTDDDILFVHHHIPSPTQPDTTVFATVDVDGNVQIFAKLAGWMSGPCFSPDGQRIAFTRHRILPGYRWTRDLYVMNRGTRQLSFVIEDVMDARFTPDGEHLIYTNLDPVDSTNYGTIWTIDLDGSNPRLVAAH